MSPASKEEWATIKECSVKISHLEDAFKELKQELRNERKEKVETRRHISNRRLAIYLALASIFGGVIVKILDLIACYLFPT